MHATAATGLQGPAAAMAAQSLIASTWRQQLFVAATMMVRAAVLACYREGSRPAALRPLACCQHLHAVTCNCTCPICICICTCLYLHLHMHMPDAGLDRIMSRVLGTSASSKTAALIRSMLPVAIASAFFNNVIICWPGPGPRLVAGWCVSSGGE
jgi:hypothetical protein